MRTAFHQSLCRPPLFSDVVALLSCLYGVQEATSALLAALLWRTRCCRCQTYSSWTSTVRSLTPRAAWPGRGFALRALTRAPLLPVYLCRRCAAANHMCTTAGGLEPLQALARALGACQQLGTLDLASETALAYTLHTPLPLSAPTCCTLIDVDAC